MCNKIALPHPALRALPSGAGEHCVEYVTVALWIVEPKIVLVAIIQKALAICPLYFTSHVEHGSYNLCLYSMKNLHATRRRRENVCTRHCLARDLYCMLCLRHRHEQFRHSESSLSLPRRYVVVGYRYKVVRLLGNFDIVTMVPLLVNTSDVGVSLFNEHASPLQSLRLC